MKTASAMGASTVESTASVGASSALAAATEAIPTVEVSSAVGTAVEVTAAAEVIAVMSASVEAMPTVVEIAVEAAMIVKIASAFAETVPAIVEVSTEETPIIEIATSPKSRASIKTVEPRARADEDAAGKPLRAVVAVRRARVGVVIVVAVGAHRRRAVVSGAAYSDADHNSLRLCVRRWNQENAKHREKSQVSHLGLPLRSAKPISSSIPSNPHVTHVR